MEFLIGDCMKKRLKSFFTINCLIFIVLISRLAYLQLINGEYYSQQAENVFSRVYREKATRERFYQGINKSLLQISKVLI